MRWEEGRQGTGYWKLRLFSKLLGRVGVDAYVLHYPPGVCVPLHTDPVDGAAHWCLNVVLVQPRRGGVFCGRSILRLGDRLVLFRPDRERHAVTAGETDRYVLSVGVAVFSSARATCGA